MAFASIRGEYHITQVQAWHGTDPLQAFAAASAAHKTNPFDNRIRIQLVLSLESLLASGRKVKISEAAADRAHQIAESASPYQAAVLISRAQYLLASGRWKDSVEIATIVGTLESKAASFPQTWMIVAAFSGLTGQMDRAAGALVKGLDAGGKFADMQRVAHSINMEIERK